MRADIVIAISENTRDDIVNYLGVDKSKIIVTPCGVDISDWQPCSEAERAEIKKRYGLSDSVVYGGHISPRKNTETLISAFDSADVDAELVFTGSEPRSKLMSRIQSTPDVKYLGFVPSEHVKTLYHVSDVFVYPSKYEGFGFPPLEAMACGTPVISSNAASLPESVGDAAIKISPEDVEGFTRAIERMLYNNGLRREYIERGAERAEKLTWERTARQTVEVFESL